ncbi:GntR family transcriptional regulator [Amycolatopsis sp. NPDC024027]|uniref:GntR family transcriptional regulator n=1 Tax=Amycolatopsis sp. NPDC024027 TaxID=3154327 RepID=UPI0033F9DE46
MTSGAPPQAGGSATRNPRNEAGEPADRPPTVKRDRVRRHLLKVIENAGPGTGLASERDLAAELGVSRPTVRAAIDELTRTGLLVRQRGRGTFTSPHKVTQELATGLAVPPAEGHWTSRVVAFAVSPAPRSLAGELELEPGTPVLRVTRVRYVDDEPIAIEGLALPASLVPGLRPADLEAGNFYRLLRERFGIAVQDAVQTIEPAVTDPGQAELLEIAVYAPILHIERLTRDTTGRIVELTRSVYRGDRYRITSNLRFDAESG